MNWNRVRNTSLGEIRTVEPSADRERLRSPINVRDQGTAVIVVAQRQDQQRRQMGQLPQVHLLSNPNPNFKRNGRLAQRVFLDRLADQVLADWIA